MLQNLNVDKKYLPQKNQQIINSRTLVQVTKSSFDDLLIVSKFWNLDHQQPLRNSKKNCIIFFD